MPHQDLRVPSTDAAEIEKTVVVDMRDLDPDLVDVPSEHHPRLSLGIQGRHGIPVHVGTHVVGERADLVAPHAARCLLKSRGPRRVEQLLQKSDGLDGHAVVDGVVMVS